MTNLLTGQRDSTHKWYPVNPAKKVRCREEDRDMLPARKTCSQGTIRSLPTYTQTVKGRDYWGQWLHCPPQLLPLVHSLQLAVSCWYQITPTKLNPPLIILCRLKTFSKSTYDLYVLISCILLYQWQKLNWHEKKRLNEIVQSSSNTRY